MSRRFSLTKTLSSAFLSSSEEKKDDDDTTNSDSSSSSPTFLSSPNLGPRIASILEKYATKIHDDSFLKIVRQLEFWHADQSLGEEELVALAERLAKIASWREELEAEEESVKEEEQKEKFTIPKVRFGRTEIEMPIVTCGGMRVQETWIPDVAPLIKPNKSKVVKSKSQDNLKDVILSCLKIGLNHFETARMYGSSEVQFVSALVELINDGSIKRSDFIFQTKLPVGRADKREQILKQWDASWSNVNELGYVDLFAFHCVSEKEQVDTILSEDEDGVYQFALDLQKEGKIKYIGFSTHGNAENIMRMVSSNKFDYVNLHKHYFGDYHAAGTPDTFGGQGNAAAVKKALELDMGVFNISPFDKGGKLYRPSAAVAAAIGLEMSPIAFSALHAWKTQKMHTVSVGFARSSDLDEVIEAARIYAQGEKADELVKAAESRLDALAIEKLGKEWHEKGLINVPSFYEESSDGMAIGHMLWIHNCLTAYGMEDFAMDRYGMLEKITWSTSKSFEENKSKGFNAGNPGRCFDPSVDLTEALKNHYNPELVKSKIAEVHAWLNKDSSLTEEEKINLGWKRAYNLTTWEEFPGETLTISAILLSRMGLKNTGGNNTDATKEAKVMRGIVRRSSTMELQSTDDDE